MVAGSCVCMSLAVFSAPGDDERVFAAAIIPGKDCRQKRSDLFQSAGLWPGYIRRQDLQKRADFIVTVVRQPVAVGDDYQKQIQQKLMVAEAAPKSLTQKAMFDKGKACGDFSDTMGLKWLFFDVPTLCFVSRWSIVRWWPQWRCARLLGSSAGAIGRFKVVTLFFHG